MLKNNRYKVLIAFLCGAIFSLTVMFPIAYKYRGEIRPYMSYFMALFKSQQLEINTSSKKISSYQEVKNLNTSELPLKIGYVDLKDFNFLNGAGQLHKAGNKLYVMSRSGEIYIFDDKNLNYRFSIPNSFNEALSKYASDSSNAFRAFDLHIECSEEKIFTSFIKFNKIKNNFSFEVSSNNFDCIGSSVKNDNWLTLLSIPITLAEATNSASAGGAIYYENKKLFVGFAFTEDENALEVDEIPNSFDDRNLRGKILMIDVENNDIAVFTRGHRNIGAIIKNVSNILSIEHGPEGGDEINLIKSGKNFGYPIWTYGTDYGSFKWKNESMKSDIWNVSDPLFAFVPSIAPSDMINLINFNSKWDNNLLISGLKSQSIYRLKTKKNKVIYSEPIWIGHRVRSIEEFNSNIFILTDKGLLGRIEIDEIALLTDVVGADKPIHKNSPLNKCIQCHSVYMQANSSSAPNLYGVLGREIAKSNYDEYSKALRDLDGKWTKEKLKKYLKNPQEFAKGTTMPNLGLSNLEINMIISELEERR